MKFKLWHNGKDKCFLVLLISMMFFLVLLVLETILIILVYLFLCVFLLLVVVVTILMVIIWLSTLVVITVWSYLLLTVASLFFFLHFWLYCFDFQYGIRYGVNICSWFRFDSSSSSSVDVSVHLPLDNLSWAGRESSTPNGTSTSSGEYWLLWQYTWWINPQLFLYWDPSDFSDGKRC